LKAAAARREPGQGGGEGGRRGREEWREVKRFADATLCLFALIKQV
jgi:hypothetical protein